MPILREIPATETDGVPIKIWTDQVEDNAEQQLRALASSGFAIGHVAAMPDVHAGSGTTIGSVFATRDLLLPTAIGADIGCGVLAQPFDLRAIDLSPAFLRELHGLIKTHIPTGNGQHVTPQEWDGFTDDARYTRAVAAIIREKGPTQLGSLGGGNHFIELCREVDTDHDTARVWLLIHSGSRGAGSLIAAHHVAIARQLSARNGAAALRDLWPLPLDRSEGQNYLRDLRWAQEYAAENRRRMLEEFIEIFARLLKKRLRRDLDCDHTAGINISHNYAAQETIFGEALWVHRKGATFAGVGALGIIPGSMAIGSYLVRGLGNPDSLNSCSHGAGRLMSRGQAARSITLESFAKKMEGIVAETGKEFLDEAPQAYKDLDTVIANQSDLVEPIGRLQPLLNLKGSGRWQPVVDTPDTRTKQLGKVKKDRTRDKDDPLQRRKLAQRGRG
ncbi:MAG TPA: RtcB family protein [Thermomicrobiales bacterium]|jgi:tRNA-splicing ligase RtcB